MRGSYLFRASVAYCDFSTQLAGDR